MAERVGAGKGGSGLATIYVGQQPPSPSKALDPALPKEVFRARDRWRSWPKYALGKKYNEVLKHNMREDLPL